MAALFKSNIARVFWLTYSKRVELKATDITDLVVSSYGNYYWKAKINGLAREGALDTKSISVMESKLFRDFQAAKAGY